MKYNLKFLSHIFLFTLMLFFEQGFNPVRSFAAESETLSTSKPQSIGKSHPIGLCDEVIEPYLFKEDFEVHDPFTVWTSKGNYNINYKGLTEEKALSGTHSFKLDVSIEAGGYLYFEIPVQVMNDGALSLSANMWVTYADGVQIALGTNVDLIATSGVIVSKRIDYTTEQWISLDSIDIVEHSKNKIARLYVKDFIGDNAGFITPSTDRIGLFLFASKGGRITAFIDDIRLKGNVPNYEICKIKTKKIWRRYKRKTFKYLESKIGEINDNISTSCNQAQIFYFNTKRKAKRIEKEALARGYLSKVEYNRLNKLLDTVALVEKQCETESNLFVFPWDPFNSEKVLPSTYPLKAEIGDTVSLKACRKEFEPASFVIQSKTDIRNLRIITTDLMGPNGSTLSKNAIDVRLVKCWFQAGDKSVGKGKTTLTPELLLKDDSLVKIDEDAQINYLKIRIAGEEKYINISSVNFVFPDKAEIHDASILQPFYLKAKTNKQVWLTFYIPGNAVIGEYRGTILLKSGGQLLKEINVKLTVLPFELQDPVIEYGLYYTARIREQGPFGIQSNVKSKKQYKIELQSMKDHGVMYPVLYQNFDSMLGEALNIRKEVGLPTDKLYTFGMRTDNVVPIGNTSLESIKRVAEKWKEFVSNYGYKDLYIYGKDEAKTEVLKAQRDAWRIVHSAQTKVFVACYENAVGIVGDLLDLPVLSGAFKPKIVKKWHDLGKKVFIYGNPQVGVEDPIIYRRNYGFSTLCNGYDGVMNFAYQYGFGHIWNDFDYPIKAKSSIYRDHVFAYPTSNGVIDTIQWEGFREAVDDVKYFTTLMKKRNILSQQFLCKRLELRKSSSAIRQEVINKIIKQD